MSVPFARAHHISHQLIASKLTMLVAESSSQKLSLLHSNIPRAFYDSIALRQQQMAAIPDRRLSNFGKALQQPRQCHLESDVIIRDVEMSSCRLPQRSHAKNHAVSLPSFFVDFQHRHVQRRTRQAGLETTTRFIATEVMRNRNHKRF
jgi:hypothetical protein